MTRILRQSTAVDVRIGPFVDVGDAFTPETGITLGAADEAEALRAGTATLDISALTWAAVTGADGWYTLSLSTTATNTVGELIIVVQDDSVCLPVWASFYVVEEAVYDAFFAASAGMAVTLATGAITAAVVATGAIDADAIADNAIDAGAIASGAITSAKFAAGAIDATAIANGAIDAATFATGAIDAAALAADAGTEIATAVWASATRTLTALDEDDTTIDLNAAIAAAVPTAAAIADAVWDEDATGHQTGGTFGQAIGDPGADTTTIYQSVVTDAAGTNVAADIIAIKTETASILTDTAEIGAAGAGLTNINLPDQTMNITGNITGNLSGSVGSVTGAVGSVTGAVGSVTGLTVSDVAAIKAKTDSLTFTVAGKTDANITYVNGTAVDGAGTEGDPWGPV